MVQKRYKIEIQYFCDTEKQIWPIYGIKAFQAGTACRWNELGMAESQPDIFTQERLNVNTIWKAEQLSNGWTKSMEGMAR